MAPTMIPTRSPSVDPEAGAIEPGSDPIEPGAGRQSRMRRLAILGGPTTRPISGRRLFPLYGIIHHVGRKSGREYATPVVVRATGEGVFVPLPFGPRTDWYRNAVVAGGVRVTWKGGDHWLTGAQVVDRAGAGAAFSPLMRGLMRLAGIDRVVRFDSI